jgi:ligand-binding sensor domain-containing protein/signal transduction histidine kinase/CheY-like chemotaxis protein/AraC-like DNA-binding protein
MRILLLLLFCCNLLFVAGQSPAFDHLTVENGLSQNSVMSIVQDHRGMMWYGTRYGLNRYDARQFRVYTKSLPGQGLTDDYIITLFCDSDNTLWAGTLAGLNRYDARQDVFVPVNIQRPNRNVNAILEDRQRRLWVTSGNTLLVADQLGKPAFHTVQVFPEDIKCVFETSNRLLLIGTGKGLYLQKGTSFELIPHTILAGSYIASIAEDAYHTFWIGTYGNGLLHYTPATGQAEQFLHTDGLAGTIPNNNIRKVLLRRDGSLWIGTQEGLCRKLPGSNQFAGFLHSDADPASLSQNSVHSLYEDRDGTLWIGTFFGGINSLSGYRTPFHVYRSNSTPARLSNNTVSSIAEDASHNLWIGTEGGGLNYIDRKTGTSTYYRHAADNPASISSNLVKAVYRDKDGQLWAGTHGGGLNLFNPSGKTFTRFFYKDKDANSLTSEITCLNEDGAGRFWIGTQKGVMVFRRSGQTLLPDPAMQQQMQVFSNVMVLFIFRDSGGQVWLGTESALYLLHQDRLLQLAGPATGSKLSFRINCINEDAAGNIWVGTYYNGLYRYNRNGQLQEAFTQQKGLPDNNVVGILEDARQQLWISTGNGLSKYDPLQHQFRNYYTDDGIAGNVFNNNAFFKTAAGEMFFGGYNGLTSFFPNDIRENKTPPSVAFSALSVLGQPVSAGDSTGLLQQDISYTSRIHLQHTQNMFAVELSVLNYIKQGKNRYAYQLQGSDKEWKYTSDPVFRFSNLPPGNYVLLAKGSNNDGYWSQPVSIQIQVDPPFWKTWKAYTLYALALAALLFLVTRFFFLREWVKRNNALTQYKLNFFTNISHEIRTHLSLITGPAENLLLDENNHPQTRQQLQVMKQHSESLLQLVNELMDFRKAESGYLHLQVSDWELVGFLQDILHAFHTLSVNRNITASFHTGTPAVTLWFDKVQLEKVFFNLLSNAFKFTGSGGTVHLQVEETPDTVIVQVTDSGKGIAPENLHQLFDNYYQENDYGVQNNGYGIGLALAKSIVTLHHGNIAVESRQQQNTLAGYARFTVTLKKGKDHFEANSIYTHTVPQREAVAATPVYTPATETGALPAPETSHTVLLVEDNPEIRQFITRALQGQYHFVEAENGLQGWETATELIPDLIISDVMMPVMDGITLCRQLKSDQRTSHIPVILLTAKATIEHQITGLQTGADLYLPKPFSIQVLALHIYNIIAARERLWQRFGRPPEVAALPFETEAVQPAAHDTEVLHPLDAAFISNITQIIEENIFEPDFTIAVLSTKAGMSQPVLSKKIKAVTGLSTNDFVKSLRLKKAAVLLREKRYTVYEIAYMIGYEDSKYFSKEFKKYFGKLPSVYAQE